MRLIPLTKGYSAMVDDADFEWLNQWKWCARVTPYTVYAFRGIEKNKKRSTIQMHRQILGLSNRMVFGEHKDGNGLNNTRGNIRPCTPSQNMMNKVSESDSSSRFKGVYWHKDAKSWCAIIVSEGVRTYIGVYENEEDAARWYNHFAKERHKEFAKFNEVNPMFPTTQWEHKILIAGNSSGFRGVSFHKIKNKWRSCINRVGTHKHIGYFDNPTDAAIAYDNAAREIHGDSARLNFPPQPNGPAFKSDLENIWAENEGDLDETKI